MTTQQIIDYRKKRWDDIEKGKLEKLRKRVTASQKRVLGKSRGRKAR